MFRMKTVNQLNGRQRGEVRALEEVCCVYDSTGGGITLSADAPEEEKTYYFLCYQEDELVGFASLYCIEGFLPEVNFYIHPDFRVHAMRKKMTTGIKKVMEKNDWTNVYVVHEPSSKDDYLYFLEQEPYQYSHSEYIMEWKFSYALLPTTMLSVHELLDSELLDATDIFAGAFGVELQDAKAHIKEIRAEGYTYYIAIQSRIPVGIFAVSIEEESVHLFDFAVDADVQGRGIGKNLLKEFIRIAQENMEQTGRQKRIQVQVGSKNEAAFRLYQKNGFQVTSQRDYYLGNVNEQ